MRLNGTKLSLGVGAVAVLSLGLVAGSSTADPATNKALPSASPEFITMMRKLEDKKPAIMKSQRELLAKRYDLSGTTDPVARMSGGKPIPVGPTIRLPQGVTLDALASLSADEIKRRNLFPDLPLPHPLEPDGGGVVFPPSQLKTHPELQRVDLDFDIPDAYLPQFPPPLYLTTHPGRGDVSRGQEITLDNYYPLLKDILTPLQLDGARLLVTPFPQQQFNRTEDRASWSAANAVSCFSCHVNGHTTGQFHRVPDVRPHADRPRIETVSLRGVFTQRTFGSKRNLRSLEDFTEVENNTAYFRR